MPQPIMAPKGPAQVADKPPAQPRPSEEKALVPTGINPVKADPEASPRPPVVIEAKMIPMAPAAIIPSAPKREEPQPAKAEPARNDPFADLDTLEAEMARLLGRDKLS